MSKTKYFLFRHYGSVALIMAAGIVLASWSIARNGGEWKPVATSLAGVVSFAYFVQKQKLEETRLISEFFTRFNERYDRLNDTLLDITRKEPSSDLTREERRCLNDYFNLCGEEYLMWCQGYVYPQVWKSWFIGMKVYYKHPSVHPMWASELKTGSYYGLEEDLSKS